MWTNVDTRKRGKAGHCNAVRRITVGRVYSPPLHVDGMRCQLRSAPSNPSLRGVFLAAPDRLTGSQGLLDERHTPHRIDDWNLAKLLKHEQIAITGDDGVGVSAERGGEHVVVVRIATDRCRQIDRGHQHGNAGDVGDEGIGRELGAVQRGGELGPMQHIVEFGQQDGRGQ